MKYNITESIIINKPVAEVYQVLTSFKKWNDWSPWAITDPNVQNGYQGTGGNFGDIMSWEGKISGVGEMEVIDVQENAHLSYELRFKKPFPSKAITSFTLAETGNGTELVWHMAGNLPWFLFFMKTKMMAFIRTDFTRGLKMIKEYLEEGSVSSHLEYLGEVDFEGCTVLGKKAQSHIETIGTDMMAGMTEVVNFAMAQNIEMKRAISVYTKSDMVNQTYDYISGFEVDGGEQGDLEHYSIPAGKYAVMRHSGSWDHLANAWMGIYMHLRAHKIKVSKTIKPFEIYQTGPDHNPKEHVTDIYVPLK